MLKNKNIELVGKKDLWQEYKELNHLTHRKLVSTIRSVALSPVFRKSHSRLNKFKWFKNMNIRIFPFNYLITKEFLLLKNHN